MTDKSCALLVVDDEPFNRTLIKRQLDNEGYEDVSFAENGREALDMVAKKTFDIILLDIEMPEIDGFGVLEALKSDMKHRQIPVVMISAVEDIETIARCISMGAEGHLPKPFNPTILNARLSSCLEKKRFQDQEASYLSRIREEKKRADELIAAMLPVGAANELKSTGQVLPREYDDVAVLFCDIVDFTAYSNSHSATEIVTRLQALFSRLEAITAQHGMEKIKTIGDEFMATAGLTVGAADPTLTAITCGLKMIEAVPEITPDWHVRVGVHSGPLVAGIVGDQKYQFDVWGNTVNMASRMASHGKPGVVTIAHDTWLKVQQDCLGRRFGNADVKGIGSLELIEVYGLQ